MSKLPAGLDRLPSGRIRARYRDRDGRQHSASFDQVRPAQRWRTAQLAALDAGTHVAPNRITVAEYARQYAAARHHRASTIRSVETRLVLLSRTPLGRMRLGDVRTSHARAWLTEIEKHYAPSTARQWLTFARAIFAAAVDDRLIGASPFTARVTPARRTRQPVVPLTVDQVRTFAAGMPPRYHAVILLGAGTGMRLGELLGLRVSDVDFLRREVHVRQQLAAVTHTVGPLKTDGSARTLPLPASAADALAAHLSEFGPGPDDLLFGSATGKFLRHDEVQRFAAASVRDGGLPEGASVVGLRHHYASTLLAAGVDVFKVAGLLGHSTPKLVVSTYGHMVPDGGVLARKAIEAAWTGGSVTAVSRAGG